MDTGTIGIKTADRSFVPVLQEGSTRKRRVVLTTVHDHQTKVQIDLYRGSAQAEGFEPEQGAEYVGSLLLEEIPAQGKGSPEIELLLHQDEDGNLSASARELSSGSYQSLSLRLESLTDDGMYDMPDFEIDGLDDELGNEQESGFQDDDLDDIDLSGLDEAGAPENDFSVPDSPFDDLELDLDESDVETPAPAYVQRHAFDEEEQDGFVEEPVAELPNPALLVGFVILALVMLGILSYFVFRALEGPQIPPLEVEALLPMLCIPRKGRRS